MLHKKFGNYLVAISKSKLALKRNKHWNAHIRTE